MRFYGRKRKAHGGGTTGRYLVGRDADWAASLKKDMLDMIRTEVRLRHRTQLRRELEQLEAAATARFWDMIGLGVGPEFKDYAEVEEILAMTRPQLFAYCGREDVSGVVDYSADKELELAQVRDKNGRFTAKLKPVPSTG